MPPCKLGRGICRSLICRQVLPVTDIQSNRPRLEQACRALVFVRRVTKSNIRSTMFEIDALDHVALSVRDVERSVRWYSDVLGFKRLHEDKWNGIPAFVGNADASIALFPASDKIGSASTDRAAVRTLH